MAEAKAHALVEAAAELPQQKLARLLAGIVGSCATCEHCKGPVLDALHAAVGNREHDRSAEDRVASAAATPPSPPAPGVQSSRIPRRIPSPTPAPPLLATTSPRRKATNRTKASPPSSDLRVQPTTPQVPSPDDRPISTAATRKMHEERDREARRRRLSTSASSPRARVQQRRRAEQEAARSSGGDRAITSSWATRERERARLHRPKGSASPGKNIKLKNFTSRTRRRSFKGGGSSGGMGGMGTTGGVGVGGGETRAGSRSLSFSPARASANRKASGNSRASPAATVETPPRQSRKSNYARVPHRRAQSSPSTAGGAATPSTPTTSSPIGVSPKRRSSGSTTRRKFSSDDAEDEDGADAKKLMPSPVLTPSSPAVRRRSGDNALAKSLEGLITDDILDEIAMTGTPKSDADASPSSPSRKAKADPSLWGGGNAAPRHRN